MKNLANIAKTILFIAIVISITPMTTYADSKSYEKNDNGVIIYFTRHAEKQTELKKNADGSLTKVCGKDKCSEVLNPEGELRAEKLAQWFRNQGITENLTHAFSSHKTRTRQTIQQIAVDAGLGAETKDNDKNAGDGIQEFPVMKGDKFATELSPEGTSKSEKPTIEALLALEKGSVALVAGHSGTLYDIMAGIGLEDACTKKTIKAKTCNADRYPFNKKNKVANFGDIWRIDLMGGKAEFKFRKNLQFSQLKSEELVN